MLIMILLFKQKPAYEMGISDWSLDVCSSDLQAKKALDVIAKNMDRQVKRGKIGEAEKQAALKRISSGTGLEMFADSDIVIEAASENEEIKRAIRTEEHKSELKSIMRITSAVFCLKKNTTYYHYDIITYR